MMKHSLSSRYLTAAAAGAAALLAACGSPPPDPTPVAKVAPAAPTTAPPQVIAQPPVVQTVRTSGATNPRAYRSDAATHLYGLHQERIWKGRMPPLLYAVGVLQVEVDSKGMVNHVSWMRAPKHAPEVIAEIEKMVRAAAPYPVPVRMGKVVYTDTWLWHKSGKFQLDTLTEGQD
jgi:periplasmic protein TonB